MKRQHDTAAHSIRFAVFALVLLALQVPSALGQTVPLGSSGPCTTHAVGGNFAATYLDASKPDEQAYWEAQVAAQKAWYATIVGAEREGLNKDKAARTQMLNRVCKAAFGRDAQAGDLDYWLPRDDTYRAVLDANRNWLYSAAGAKDLSETVRRALKAAKGVEPNGEQVKAAAANLTPGRPIYVEMVTLLTLGAAAEPFTKLPKPF